MSSTELVSQELRSALKLEQPSNVDHMDLTRETSHWLLSLLNVHAFSKVWNISSTLEVFQDEMLPKKDVALAKTSVRFFTLLTSHGRLDEKEVLCQNICSISTKLVVFHHDRSPKKLLAPMSQMVNLSVL